MLKERGNKTAYFSNNSPFFHHLSSDVVPLVEDALSQFIPGNDSQFYTVLWYLSKTLTRLTSEMRQTTVKLFIEGDSIIRFNCIEIICRTDDELAAQSVIKSGWKASIDGQCELEKEWGSILLGRFGLDLSFEELASRILPVWIGYAVKVRGCKPVEVEAYAQLLHSLWRRIANPAEDLESLLRHVRISVGSDEKNPVDELSVDLNAGKSVMLANDGWGGSVGMVSHNDIKRAFNPKIAEEEWKAVHKKVIALFQRERTRRNDWIGVSFAHGGLDIIVEQATPFWHEWIEPVLSGNRKGHQLLVQCQGFYERLCAALLTAAPETGIALFKIIMDEKSIQITDSQTGIRQLLLDLFEAHDSPLILNYRKQFLCDCDSDLSLFNIAFMAQLFGKTEWMNDIAQEWIEADNDFNNARGLALLGFSNDAIHAERLQWWITNHQTSWVMAVAKKALQRHKRNSWARFWLQQFIEEDDRVRAWAGFRLFLCCVDRRFWIWRSEILGREKLTEWKNEAYRINRGTVEDSIKKSDEQLKKTFVGQAVKENELWPWMKRYTGN
jgi:hypothetical protein